MDHGSLPLLWHRLVVVVTGGMAVCTDVCAVVTTALVVDVGHKAVAGVVVAAAGATVAITATGTASSIVVVVVVECAHGVVLVVVVVG